MKPRIQILEPPGAGGTHHKEPRPKEALRALLDGKSMTITMLMTRYGLYRTLASTISRAAKQPELAEAFLSGRIGVRGLVRSLSETGDTVPDFGDIPPQFVRVIVERLIEGGYIYETKKPSLRKALERLG